MYYANSLARVYGPPGCGKSFMVMDQALSLATGVAWYGQQARRMPVMYVMAEGQAVNRDRAEAWLSRRGKDRDDLRGGWFAVVPDAIQLTETGVKPLVSWIEKAERTPKLIFLDTKNAMMVGEENSASDFARMRRSLDALRKASGGCVVLVDHTGYEGTRARGSSAATAGMDTEIRVSKDDSERPAPARITAELTRHKAGEAGAKWHFRLMPEHPAAVLDPDFDVQTVIEEPGTEWAGDDVRVPRKVRELTGRQGLITVDLAKYMVYETGPENDPDRLGRTFADTARDLKSIKGHPRTTVQRAWSQLKDMGYLESIFSDPTETQERTGAHVWSGPVQ